jgi:hypothetical protein
MVMRMLVRILDHSECGLLISERNIVYGKKETLHQ